MVLMGLTRAMCTTDYPLGSYTSVHKAEIFNLKFLSSLCKEEDETHSSALNSQMLQETEIEKPLLKKE